MTETDLATFVRARLDEAEQLARATRPDGLKPAKWAAEPWLDGTGERCDLRDLPLGALTSHGALEVAHAKHIAYHDPARVLADIDAKRRIIDRYVELRDRCDAAWREYSDWIDGKPTPEPATQAGQHDRAICDELATVLRLHAAPFADHPDYRDEWRP